jgi:hypothetical protein
MPFSGRIFPEAKHTRAVALAQPANRFHLVLAG